MRNVDELRRHPGHHHEKWNAFKSNKNSDFFHLACLLPLCTILASIRILHLYFYRKVLIKYLCRFRFAIPCVDVPLFIRIHIYIVPYYFPACLYVRTSCAFPCCRSGVHLIHSNKVEKFNVTKCEAWKLESERRCLKSEKKIVARKILPRTHSLTEYNVVFTCV